MRRSQLVIDDTGSVEGIYAFIYCKKWRSGQVLPMPDRLTDWLTTLKDSATQLLTKYKSGALVTQYWSKHAEKYRAKKEILWKTGGNIGWNTQRYIVLKKKSYQRPREILVETLREILVGAQILRLLHKNRNWSNSSPSSGLRIARSLDKKLENKSTEN